MIDLDAFSRDVQALQRTSAATGEALIDAVDCLLYLSRECRNPSRVIDRPFLAGALEPVLCRILDALPPTKGKP